MMKAGRRSKRAAMAVLCATLVLPCAAGASTFDTYGYGSRGLAMGGALTALSVTCDAIYYNPANLLSRKQTQLGFGLSLVAPSLSVDRKSGEGPLGARMPATNMGFHIGLATPIGGVFEDKVGVGILLYHPLLSMTKVESVDPSFPYFYRYDSLPDKLIIAAGLAYEPVDLVRIGLGVQVLAEINGRVYASVSLVEQRIKEEQIDIDVVGSAGITAGISLGPLYGVRLGASWRSPLELRYRLPMDILLEEIGWLNVVVNGVALYTPGQLSIGLSWESGPYYREGVTVEVGLTWELWSAAPPAGAAFSMTIDDSVLRAEEAEDGRETQFLIEATEVGTPLAARDIIVPRLGVEYRPTAQWTVRAGYFYRPTPLPLPIYDTNTLDSNAHGISLGGGYTFADPTGIAAKPLILDVGLLVTVLEERRVDKAVDGEPAGSYVFGGAIFALTADLRHTF